MEKGCNRQFAVETMQYPDYRCIDGRLWDDDNCDVNGNLYTPEDPPPCPYCKPGEFESQQDAESYKELEWNNFRGKG